MQQQAPPERFDLANMVADLNSLLRLKTTVIGMKMFASADEMAAIPKIRRPSAVHTTDQIVSMASRLGWTVGITADNGRSRPASPACRCRAMRSGAMAACRMRRC